MKTKTIAAALLAFSMFAISCKDEGGAQPLPETGGKSSQQTMGVSGVPGGGGFFDLGNIPALIDAEANADFQNMVYLNGYVLVATTDGVWKCDLTSRQWSRSGFAGRSITALYVHPTITNKVYAGIRSNGTLGDKTVHISTNGGTTWTAASAPVIDQSTSTYENYACFVVRPNYPNQVFANLYGGRTIAVSADGGNTWSRANNATASDGQNAPGVISFLPGNPYQLYQGVEAPLDQAKLSRYQVDLFNPVLLGAEQIVVPTSVWGNRRPNQMQSHTFTGSDLYVGLEGAFCKVSSSGLVTDIYKDLNGQTPYPYIKGIWVDPANSNHMLFGGSPKVNESAISLFETYNQGVNTYRFKDRFGLDNPMVLEIIGTNSYPAILLSDRGRNQVKLVLYKP